MYNCMYNCIYTIARTYYVHRPYTIEVMPFHCTNSTKQAIAVGRFHYYVHDCSPHNQPALSVFVLASLPGAFTFDKALFSPFCANGSLTVFRNDLRTH